MCDGEKILEEREEGRGRKNVFDQKSQGQTTAQSKDLRH